MECDTDCKEAQPNMAEEARGLHKAVQLAQIRKS
jgi:hypothetical protein